MKKAQKDSDQHSVSIQLAKKQYWNLLRAVYMADWMANAICERDMKEDEGIKKIRNHIFSFAKEMGYSDYAEYDDMLKDFYATWDLDDEPSVRALIDRYDDSTFWQEILERFADRDFFKKYTREEIGKMSKEEYFEKHFESEEVWVNELEEHGIERFKIEHNDNNS